MSYARKKYVISEVNGHTVVTLFSEDMQHRGVATGLREQVIMYGGQWSHRTLSAGFFFLTDGEVQVEGRSDSLDCKSRPEDAELIAQFLGLKELADG